MATLEKEASPGLRVTQAPRRALSNDDGAAVDDGPLPGAVAEAVAPTVQPAEDLESTIVLEAGSPPDIASVDVSEEAPAASSTPAHPAHPRPRGNRVAPLDVSTDQGGLRPQELSQGAAHPWASERPSSADSSVPPTPPKSVRAIAVSEAPDADKLLDFGSAVRMRPPTGGGALRENNRYGNHDPDADDSDLPETRSSFASDNSEDAFANSFRDSLREISRAASQHRASSAQENALALADPTAMQARAYVPLAMAKARIAKIIQDMISMKNRHVDIVAELYSTFQTIESDTQKQFEAFVLAMRQDYHRRLEACRQYLNSGALASVEEMRELKQEVSSLKKQNFELQQENQAILLKATADVHAAAESLQREAQSSAPIETKLAAAGTVADSAALEAARKQVEQLQSKLQAASRDATQTAVLRAKCQALNHQIWQLTAQPVLLCGLLQSDQSDRQGLIEELRSEAAAERSEAQARIDLAGSELDEWRMEFEQTYQRAPTKAEIGAAVPRVASLHNARKALAIAEGKMKALDRAEGLPIDDDEEEADDSAEADIAILLASTSDSDYARLLHRQQKQLRLAAQRLRALEEVFVVDREADLRAHRDKVQEQVGAAEAKVDAARDALREWHEAFVARTGIEPSDKELAESCEQFLVLETEEAALERASANVAHLESLLQNPSSTWDAYSLEFDNFGGDDVQDGLYGFSAASSERVLELEEELAELREKLEASREIQFAADTRQVEELQKQLADQEKAHADSVSRMRIEQMRLEEQIARLETLKQESAQQHSTAVAARHAELGQLQLQLEQTEITLAQKKAALAAEQDAVRALREERLVGVEIDTANEIRELQSRLDAALAEQQELMAQRAEFELEAGKLCMQTEAQEKQLAEAQSHIKSQQEKLETERTRFSERLAALDAEIAAAASAKADADEDRRQHLLESLESLRKDNERLRAELSDANDAAVAASAAVATAVGGASSESKSKGKSKPAEGAQGSVAAGSGMSSVDKMKMDKKVKDLERKVDLYKKQDAQQRHELTASKERVKELERELRKSQEGLQRAEDELSKIGESAKKGMEALEQLETTKSELKAAKKSLSAMEENYLKERHERKRLHNVIEDMKGKIRVYCRVRPLSGSELERGNFACVSSPDEFSCVVKTDKVSKEFQFDQVFAADSSQEKVYEDTHTLIQSAVDGYNVCIFAYGQTGSGKTFTMIGDSNRPMNFPGLAPRAFEDIFAVCEANKSKFSFKISCYMIELYCNKLIDLFGVQQSGYDPAKLKVKKDMNGMVFVEGSVTRTASSAEELYSHFEEGSSSRHVASTKMNAESSRSHLIIAVTIESTNLLTKAVVTGKLSLVDLAGSERAAKTGATGQQIKEAQSINQSLTSLGNVISALSSGAKHIPYRDNMLTLLMQDSLGGNAKTLMFVNISPADYNAAETVISLTYASRVKLITNDAKKNADNQKIAELSNQVKRFKKALVDNNIPLPKSEDEEAEEQMQEGGGEDQG
eukprot:m.8688 g.8688  ORF g.8688 m.8688 type:complete len:1499 (-) comp2889_c0_seq1:1587-6083(-)